MEGGNGNVLFKNALNTFYLRYMEGRKEMFYLTMHSTHFSYVYMEGRNGNVLFKNALNTFYLRLYGRKEGNVLFNDALNTFYLRLYGRKKRKCFI